MTYCANNKRHGQRMIIVIIWTSNTGDIHSDKLFSLKNLYKQETMTLGDAKTCSSMFFSCDIDFSSQQQQLHGSIALWTVHLNKKVHLYLQLFVERLMSYLRYLCLFVHSGVQHILCCVFCFVCLRLCCQFHWFVHF